MSYLILGLCSLVALFLLGRLLVTANPGTLAKALRLGGGGLLGIVGLFLILRGMLLFGGPLVLVGLSMFARGLGWQGFGSIGGSRRSQSGASNVSTDWLEMSLDHDSGQMDGRILKGPFEGKHLSNLSQDELLSLLQDVQNHDADSARLVEAYLDRAWPDWRDQDTGEPSRTSGPMSVHEALTVLELPDDATDEQVRQAHKRLMKEHHPDQGGSAWYATKLNQARDTLLSR